MWRIPDGSPTGLQDDGVRCAPDIACIRACVPHCNAVPVKIDKDNYRIVEEEFMDGISLDDLVENLPETSCRCVDRARTACRP